MGSYSRGDVAQSADGVNQQNDHWRDFDSASRLEFDQEAAPAPQSGMDDPNAARLARAIQHEVIPRLMLVHGQQKGARSANAGTTQPIGASEVRDFVRLLMEGPEQLALAVVEALQAKGAPVEAIYLQLLAPAAHLLGEFWEQDVCDFTEVTVALGRVQRMLHVLSPRLEPRLPENFHGLSILLLAAPGEQHTLGIAMVSDFFRRAGWEVCGKPGATTAQVLALLGKGRFNALGFSLAAESNLDTLAQLIACVRRAVGSRRLCIVVGGPVFARHPEYTSRVGADLVATDGKEAPAMVRHFVMADPAFNGATPRTFQ
jgi:methanogenic corrinoid protein MtbC1